MENKSNFGMKIISMEFSVEKPIIKTTGQQDWVIWGEDNKYPQFLLDIYSTKSITHKQIIQRKVQMIAGNGIEKPSNPSQEYLNFFENRYGDMSMDEIAVKIAYDLTIFNGFTLNPHWNVDNTCLTRICYIPFERVRQDKYNVDNEGLPTYVWISENWSKWRSIDPDKYVKFNQKWNDKSQMLYYMGMDQGLKWYPEVEYSPAINYIDAEWEIGNYHNSAIKNGFHAGFLLNFGTGIPTEEEMERAYEDIRAKFTGSNNANKFILAWSNGNDGAPTLTPIPTDTSDKQYMELDKLITSKILQTHQAICPPLFGVSEPGQLGTRTELLEGLAIYQSQYVNPKQKIIEDQLNILASYCGVDISKEPIKLKKYEIDIPDVGSTPILSLGDMITMLEAIRTGQLDTQTALILLTDVYEYDDVTAKKILNTQISKAPVNPTTEIPTKISIK